MIYRFYAYGHPNIQATHKTTLEFTKDSELTLNGDCIVGINADFDSKSLKQFINNSENNNITITIKTSKNKTISETIYAELNPGFDSNNEFVIRKTDFVSNRTFAKKANKAAFDLKSDLISFLKHKENKIIVILKNKTN